MSKEFDENNAKDVYQKARAVVIDLGNQQREQAILYIKKIEQRKINELQREILSQG